MRQINQFPFSLFPGKREIGRNRAVHNVDDTQGRFARYEWKIRARRVIAFNDVASTGPILSSVETFGTKSEHVHVPRNFAEEACSPPVSKLSLRDGTMNAILPELAIDPRQDRRTLSLSPSADVFVMARRDKWLSPIRLIRPQFTIRDAPVK